MSPPRTVLSSLSQVEETTLKQMLANLMIAKKAAAAVAAAEAKARKEKTKARGKGKVTATAETSESVTGNKVGPEGGLPEATRKNGGAAVEDNKQTSEKREEGWEDGGATRGTDGRGEPGRRR